jgi:hypothetical protein
MSSAGWLDLAVGRRGCPINNAQRFLTADLAQKSVSSGADWVVSRVQHFSDETGKPERATEMVSWPYHEKMLAEKLPQEHFRRSMLVRFPATWITPHL